MKIIGIESGSPNRAGGILNAVYRVEVATMKSKRTLMTALVGLAMLATPIAAAAKDHKGHDGGGRNYSHQSESRSFNAGNKHEFRNQRAWSAAPVVAVRHDWNEDHRGWNEHRDWKEYRHDNGWHNGWRHNDGDADDYPNYGYSRYYGNRGYYTRPAYVAPYYGRRSGYASGAGSCAWAQHVRNVYARDRYTGHPSAARDLLPQLRRAEQACGGVPNGGRGLFGGYAGVPAYENYGGYNGYNNNYSGGYGQPYGYGYGYGNGYGNGYGGGSSMLAPLLQQFVH